MIASLWKAPPIMVQHFGLYIATWVAGLVTALLTLWGEDSLLEWSGGGFLLNGSQPIDIGNFFIGGCVFLVLTTLTFFLYGIITRQLQKKQTPSVSFIGGQAFLLSVLITVIGGGLIVFSRAWIGLMAAEGIISTIATIVAFLGGIVFILAFVKFSFTPILIGHGLTIKDALAESWKQTGGHFWIMVVLFLLLSIIGGLIQGIESFLPVIDAEWLSLFIGVTLTSLSMFYSVVVLATALPHPESIHSSSPRKHGRTR